jgi:RNA polymerase sigma-70 factor, ECF subfamily
MAVTETGHAASRAIDDLYRSHGGEVYRYALAVLGNHADAEDITQTTFLNAYRSLEQGVRPRKPANWLLTIASNAIKQRYRHDSARPRQVVLDDRIADRGSDEADDSGPTVGEILTALSRIPPGQRQAIVLREFEGRSYEEIAEILGVTVSALETLLFRARRSLAEELEHQLTCTEAQFAISRAADGRLGRKERKRLRVHIAECPDCARFGQVQQRHRRALRGLVLVPIPVSLTLFKGLEGSASAATLPTIGGGAAVAAGSGGAAGAVGGGVFGGGALAGGVALKAAAVVTAASVAGGVGVVGAAEKEPKVKKKAAALVQKPGKRLGQTAPRGVLVPGNGVARGKATAPGQANAPGQAKTKLTGPRGSSSRATPGGRGAKVKTPARGQGVRANTPAKRVESQAHPPQHVAPPARGRGRVDDGLETPPQRVVKPQKAVAGRSGKP